MSAEDAFLDALLADPTDFETRLVFADWLEDRGDPRGEFLRVQTELARWVPDHRRRNELLTRERQLLADHEAEWLGPLREFCDEWRWEGGLVHITIGAPHFLPAERDGVAENWLRRAWVSAVRLNEIDGFAEEVAASQQLRAVVALDLRNAGLYDFPVERLLYSPHLHRLTRLDLSNNPLCPSGVAALCNSPIFERLIWLNMRNNGLDSTTLQPLLCSLDRSRLRWIDLHGNDLSPAALNLLAAWRDNPARASSGRFTNSIGMEFAMIPAGTFVMGSPESEAQRYDDEGSQHAVTLTRTFYLGVYAVTQSQFETVMGTNPSHFTGEAVRHPPAENVSWLDAIEFCRRLSGLPEERRRGRVYRLPTEAEWEHACRAGGPPDLPFHLGSSLGYGQATFNGAFPYGGAEPGFAWERTTIVGFYEPNAFGLYDMHGNVWEWCADGMDHLFYGKSPPVDPVAPPINDYRVCRGGSWHSPGHYCRSASRGNERLDLRDRYYGFRVACDVVEPS